MTIEKITATTSHNSRERNSLTLWEEAVAVALVLMFLNIDNRSDGHFIGEVSTRFVVTTANLLIVMRGEKDGIYKKSQLLFEVGILVRYTDRILSMKGQRYGDLVTLDMGKLKWGLSLHQTFECKANGL